MFKTIKLANSGRNSVRKSRGIAVVAGEKVNFTSFSVEQNGFSAADSFSLTLPFFIREEQKGEKVLANGPTFQSKLVNQDIIKVQLYVGYPLLVNPDAATPSDLTLIMDGEMDTVEFSLDSIAGESAVLHGRAKVGAMIDDKIIDKFPGQTASQIATMFALQHGLKADVSPTTELAGTFYNQKAAVLGREISQWDLLLFLAKRENFVVRVKNGTLYFGQLDVVTAKTSSTTPTLYTWGYDIERLTIERSPHAARNLEVIVLTYDRNKKKQVRESAKTPTQSAQRISQQLGQRARYQRVFAMPGLTREQAQNKARDILEKLSHSQMIGDLTATGNTELGIDGKIKIEGIGIGLSREYFMNRITHTYIAAGEEGFKTSIGFSSETDYSQSEFSEENNFTGMTGANEVLQNAQAIEGKMYWKNSCAHAVNDVLHASGVHLPGVNDDVYSWRTVGARVASQGDLLPGDLVIVNNSTHIGIYAGNNQMWHISSNAGYVWVLAPLSNFTFTQGRRP